jgi:hypothetical protein
MNVIKMKWETLSFNVVSYSGDPNSLNLKFKAMDEIV